MMVGFKSGVGGYKLSGQKTFKASIDPNFLVLKEGGAARLNNTKIRTLNYTP
jgi:hypothetical protein